MPFKFTNCHTFLLFFADGSPSLPLVLCVGTGLFASIGFFFYRRQQFVTDAATIPDKQPIDSSDSKAFKLSVEVRNDLPTYRLKEVQKHDHIAERIWVICQCVC